MIVDKSSIISPLFPPYLFPLFWRCILELLEVHTDYLGRANREKTKITEDNYPKLWILTPTASSKILENIGAKTDGDNWGEGVYLLAQFLRTGLVVIHQLPETLDTLKCFVFVIFFA